MARAEFNWKILKIFYPIKNLDRVVKMFLC